MQKEKEIENKISELKKQIKKLERERESERETERDKDKETNDNSITMQDSLVNLDEQHKTMKILSHKLKGLYNKLSTIKT